MSAPNPAPARRFSPLNWLRRRVYTTNFRTRRLALITRQIQRIYALRGQVSVIDLGGRKQYWIDNLPDWLIVSCNVHFTLVNLPEDYYEFESNPYFTCVSADACDLRDRFPDNAFDIAHSNSTIEHVGPEKQAAFACEIRRLAPSYHVQAPYFWFPIEPHAMFPFLHWLPMEWVARLSHRVRLGHWRPTSTLEEARVRADDAHMPTIPQFRAWFPDAYLIPENYFGLTKSLIAVRLEDLPDPDTVDRHDSFYTPGLDAARRFAGRSKSLLPASTVSTDAPPTPPVQK